jgi:hypothetical protein
MGQGGGSIRQERHSPERIHPLPQLHTVRRSFVDDTDSRDDQSLPGILHRNNAVTLPLSNQELGRAPNRLGALQATQSILRELAEG